MPAFIRRRADDLMHRGGLRMSSATIQFEHGQRPSSISVSLDKASVTAWSPEYHSITNDPETATPPSVPMPWTIRCHVRTLATGSLLDLAQCSYYVLTSPNRHNPD